MPKITGNNRTSALKRLNKPYQINNSNRRLLSGSKNSSIKDARQILVNRNKTAFDARQLLSRQSSKTVNTISKNIILRNNFEQNNEDMVVVTGLKDMKMKDGRLIPTATMGETQLGKNKKIYAVGPSTFVTIRNNNNNNNNISLNQSTEKISLTKTIANNSVRRGDDDRSSQTANTLSSSANQKVVISFVNDKYGKTSNSSQPTTINSSSPLTYHRDAPPTIKRLHDASIQTTPSSSSSSRSPIRMSSYRRQNSTTMDEQDHSPERTIGDLYEPPVKRTTSSARKTTAIDKEQQVLSTVTSTGSVKRTSTGAPVSSRLTSSVSTVSKQPPPTQSSSTPGTILVTNLQPSVSEDDAIELFGEIGRINEITTLSPGCIQIVYAKREHGELAVTKYHNRLLDGQFMYVSLQKPSSNSKVTSNVQQTASNPKITTNIQQPSANPKITTNIQQPSANPKITTNIQQPSSNPKTTSNIQQPSSNSKTTSNIQKPTKENETSVSSASTTHQPLKFNASKNTSNKIAIDPAFIRQALFHPSNSATNPVQFQVKL